MNEIKNGSKYIPSNIEEKLYINWEEKGYFKCREDNSKKPFVIVMPPPNITGKLHMGHALDNTIQDIFVRYNRMKGVPTLWVPGTDHASIATEVKVLEKLKKEGKTKASVGREGFLEASWEWKKQYGGEITRQLRKIGASCDWEKERFTLDEGCSKAVEQVFINLYNQGLIYRGRRLVNWCPDCKTSISEMEVEYTEEDSFLWYIKYKIEGSDEYVVVATTRPETMLGDTAVAVNPNDERYKHLKGKRVQLPLVNKYIPIVFDDYVDKEFGTGVVKITPAHDPNDYELGIRHNLENINILNEDATLNENGLKYAGQDRYEARKNVIHDLKELGLVEKIEQHMHSVGSCYRCHTTIEPYMSLQWYVKMETLAKPAIEAVKKDEIKFIPKRFEKTYFHWMENIQDWCISRQLWWGHRIPAYYCDKCGKVTVSSAKPEHCECGGNVKQDEDTLDTWFSSALWPFSVFGWPEKTADFEYFYPTSTLVTGYDIISFWVSKMIFSGIAHTGKIPFENVYVHGLVRDSQGRKMSKSIGNGVDPLEVIANYGTDALRFSLIQNISIGNDIRYIPEKVESAKNFANKLWNAAKFVNIYIDDYKQVENLENNLKIEDKWILSKLNKTIDVVTESIDKFDIGLGIQKIYEFIWFDFCDWYIEMVKPRLYNKEDDSYLTAVWTLNHVLSNAVRLLHPYMPFISEEIYLSLKESEETIMYSKWPENINAGKYETEESQVENIMDYISQVRNIRANSNIPNNKKLSVMIKISHDSYFDAFKEAESFIKKMAIIENIEYAQNISNPENYTVIHYEKFDVYVDLLSSVNIEEEISKLDKERDRIISELKRAESMLKNEAFVSKAPDKLINIEKEKINKYTELLAKIEESIKKLS